MSQELPKYVALGGNGRYVLRWADGEVSWSSGLPNKLYGLLNGRYNNSGQDNSSISSIAFTGNDGHAVCYEGGGWQFVRGGLTKKTMTEAGAIS